MMSMHECARYLARAPKGEFRLSRTGIWPSPAEPLSLGLALFPRSCKTGAERGRERDWRAGDDDSNDDDDVVKHVTGTTALMAAT